MSIYKNNQDIDLINVSCIWTGHPKYYHDFKRTCYILQINLKIIQMCVTFIIFSQYPIPKFVFATPHLLLGCNTPTVFLSPLLGKISSKCKYWYKTPNYFTDFFSETSFYWFWELVPFSVAYREENLFFYDSNLYIFL